MNLVCNNQGIKPTAIKDGSIPPFPDRPCERHSNHLLNLYRRIGRIIRRMAVDEEILDTAAILWQQIPPLV